MTILRTDVLWIESRVAYSREDLAELSGLSTTAIDDLLACGALPAAAEGSGDGAAEAVALARAACRLRDHFELDLNGIAVAVSLLRRIGRLEARMASLQARTRASDD